MMFVLLLVSCSKDSGEEDGLISNYIEVAGVRHQIDKFVIENESEFYIGSKKDGTYISFGYTWYRVPIGERYISLRQTSIWSILSWWITTENVS